MLFSLVDKLKASEVKLSAQTEAHRAEVEDLKKKLAEMNENFEVAKAKQEISEMERSRVQKNVEELRDSKERCYEITLACAKKLKIVLQRWQHTLRSKSLSVVIPKGLSSGSTKRSKLLMKYSAIVGISVLLLAHEGSWQF
jgi:predicted RNase H-like nuclease (RuvC/YqgF family)